MSDCPDRWVVLKITSGDETIYKVLAGWYGGYTGSDRWRLNSGIERVEKIDEGYMFFGYSGSTYHCHKNRNGFTGIMGQILNSMQAGFIDSKSGSAEVMPENTDWCNFDFPK